MPYITGGINPHAVEQFGSAEVTSESAEDVQPPRPCEDPNFGKENPPAKKAKVGFAAMDPRRQREIASKGGKASQQAGTGHKFDSAEGRAAGRKGGVVVSQNREYMAAIGRKGGETPKRKKRTQ